MRTSQRDHKSFQNQSSKSRQLSSSLQNDVPRPLPPLRVRAHHVLFAQAQAGRAAERPTASSVEGWRKHQTGTHGADGHKARALPLGSAGSGRQAPALQGRTRALPSGTDAAPDAARWHARRDLLQSQGRKCAAATPRLHASLCTTVPLAGPLRPSPTLADRRLPLWLAEPGVKYPRSKYPKGIPGVTTSEFPPEWLEGVPEELYLSRRYSTAHNKHRVKSGLDQVALEAVTVCAQAVTLCCIG